jgi:protein CpxP
MNRIRLLAVASVLIFALSTVAQQATNSAGASVAAAPVEQHLKVLAEKLELSTAQQDEARPILQDMHDGTEKLMNDKSLSDDERAEKMKQVFSQADVRLRVVLNDDQKTKLDQLEQEMHNGQHGAPNGSSPAPQS